MVHFFVLSYPMDQHNNAHLHILLNTMQEGIKFRFFILKLKLLERFQYHSHDVFSFDLSKNLGFSNVQQYLYSVALLLIQIVFAFVLVLDPIVQIAIN